MWPAAGGVRLLDDLPAGPIWSEAILMNTRGQVAGSGMNEAASQRPVMWTADGRIVDMGLTSGINDAGEIVGWAGRIETVTERAFVWTESEGMLDLNDLLDDSGAGWTLRSAQAINDSGQILVRGIFDGRFTAALLTPIVPEPAATGLLAAAGLTALRRRRRIDATS